MKYLWRDGDWTPAALAAPLIVPHGQGPMIIRDQMDPMRSTLDGRLYDSKSVYTRAVKAAGYEIAGNERAHFDQQPRYEPRGVGESIKRAIAELENR